METDRSIGDRQANPGAAALSITGVVDAVEGAEDVTKFRFRNPRAMIPNLDMGNASPPGLFSPE